MIYIERRKMALCCGKVGIVNIKMVCAQGVILPEQRRNGEEDGRKGL